MLWAFVTVGLIKIWRTVGVCFAEPTEQLLALRMTERRVGSCAWVLGFCCSCRVALTCRSGLRMNLARDCQDLPSCLTCIMIATKATSPAIEHRGVAIIRRKPTTSAAPYVSGVEARVTSRPTAILLEVDGLVVAAVVLPPLQATTLRVRLTIQGLSMRLPLCTLFRLHLKANRRKKKKPPTPKISAPFS